VNLALTISPLDCVKFPQECPVGQRCLASTAVGAKGSVCIVLYERSCALPLQCDLRGEKHAAGVSFNYTNECCDTDLCNTAHNTMFSVLFSLFASQVFKSVLLYDLKLS
uniref:Uncharacterized protein n=1 Tax=Sinocyclocheilus rhinocerous TaxID=307959 RepID=A0A673LLK8_9TELE